MIIILSDLYCGELRWLEQSNQSLIDLLIIISYKSMFNDL